MDDLRQLLRAAHEAAHGEEVAKDLLAKCKESRAQAYRDYNLKLLERMGLSVGTIVEVPHRYSWDARLGKTETLAIVDASPFKLGFALGRVATKSDKLHRNQRHRVAFKIGDATDTGRILKEDKTQ